MTHETVSSGCGSRRRLLVTYSIASTFVPTTMEYLRSFQRYSRFEVDFVHATHAAILEVDFDAYDAVLNNYCVRHCFPDLPSADYVAKLKAYRGVKAMAVQDEYNRTETLRRAIEELGFDVVLTCVPQASLDYVYPRQRFARTRFETVFTGYAPETFAHRSRYARLADRPIALGYRGRDIGGQYGRLGFEKYEIGRRMKEICAQAGAAHDIAVDEESRIYGDAWFDFIGSCRAMLGSESGSNVFDFDGALERRFQEMTAAAGGVRPSYEAFRPYIERLDAEIDMGQISPRAFECALMGTAMVLFRGGYSGALTADEHYIPLEKDFSNAGEVLERLADMEGLEALTRRAYDHLIGSGAYSYRAYVGRIDDLLEAAAADKPARVRPAAPAPAQPEPLWPRVAPTKAPLPAIAFHLAPLREAAKAAAANDWLELAGDLRAACALLGPGAEAQAQPLVEAADAIARGRRLAALDAGALEAEKVTFADVQAATAELWSASAQAQVWMVEKLASWFDSWTDNVARASCGATIAASSPFFPAPHDPAGLLADGMDYAAALEGPAPHWFEIDLGRARMVRGVAGAFYDDAHRALDTRVSLLGPDRRWRTAAETHGHARRFFWSAWEPTPARRVRFEALAFAGQPRLLLRRFAVLEAAGLAPPPERSGGLLGLLRRR